MREENETAAWMDTKYDAAFKQEAKEETPLYVDEKRSPTIDPDEIDVKRTCCHSIFYLISYYSIISLLCLLFSQLMPLFLLKIEGLHFLLRCYVCLFSIVLLIVEAEMSLSFITESGIVSNWISRGIILSFLGLINKEASKQVIIINNGQEQWHFWNFFLVFQTVASWMMVVSGGLYALMGLMCLDGVKESQERQYQKNVEEEKMRKRLRLEEKFKTHV